MILITGGLGFIGTHTARALLDLGEPCVLTTRSHVRKDPDFIADEIGERVHIEELDIADQAALLQIGERQQVTGIVHLAVGAVGWKIDDFRANNTVLLNVLQAAQDWGVSRVSIASTVGVYAGAAADAATGMLREDTPLPMTAAHPIPDFKKITELVAAGVARQAGFEVVNLRLAAWGPLFHHPPSPINIPAQLVHAAVRGEAPDFSPPLSVPYAEDGFDTCYVKDCGRAIALLQTAAKLNHATYNVGTGRALKNKDVAEAIKDVIPDARIELRDGYDPNGPGEVFTLDTTRLRDDTAFVPSYDPERAVADYVAWLRAGSEY
jgi:UDP-glucose 4-epimerase